MTRRLDLATPAVMGIVNVTPDSFSDGGSYLAPAAAIERALVMIGEGARIIDVGGESTRPGAAPVGLDVERERVLPVIEGLRARSDIWISIDTVKSQIMREACLAGADMINDVTALRTPGALETAAQTGAAVCLMHMQGEPRTMQKEPVYADVVAEVSAFLNSRIAACEGVGIARERLCIDPGFGFGKTLAHNLALMRGLDLIGPSDIALLVGASRKSMFAKLADRDDLACRVHGSLAAGFWAVQQGARIIRTHDVRATCDVLAFAQALGAGFHPQT